MIKYLLAFILVICFVTEGISQKELNDYSFVVVPEKFDFVNEVDKYQLNSLTRFLFNKHGFNAFFGRELPDVRRCDGLWAEVEGKPGIVWTKVTVILNDCNGNEVYRSEVGKSKIKQYDKTYIAALRNAFLSIEELSIDQPDPQILESRPPKEIDAPMVWKEKADEIKDISIPNVEVESVEESTISETKEEIDVSGSYGKPVSDISFLEHNGTKFHLVQLSPKVGFVLTESKDFGNVDKKKGDIRMNAEGNYEFIDPTGNKFPCSFDQDKNLIIETSFQKLVFIRVAQ